MDIQNYKVFLKTAELGSFKAAADELGYTQAGVSYIINAIEDEWSTKLFIRQHGGVKLTAEGRSILPIVEDIIKKNQTLKEQIINLNSLQTGHIRIVSFESVLVHWLPGIVELYRM